MAPAVSVTTTSSMEALQNGLRSKLISVVLCSLTYGLRRNMLYSSITICAKTPFLREVSFWLTVKNDKVIQAQATNLLMLKFCVFLSLNRNFLLCRGRNIPISNSADDMFYWYQRPRFALISSTGTTLAGSRQRETWRQAWNIQGIL